MKINIEKFNPCSPALNYYKNFETSIEAWESCNRGDWMLWIASRLNVDKRKLILAKGMCAKLVEGLMHDERSKAAVQAAIDYGHNKIDINGLTAYAAVADDAAADADAAYAADADAAYAADADAAYAAYAAAAATAAADAAKRKNILRESSNICREILTDEIKSILEKYHN